MVNTRCISQGMGVIKALDSKWPLLS